MLFVIAFCWIWVRRIENISNEIYTPQWDACFILCDNFLYGEPFWRKLIKSVLSFMWSRSYALIGLITNKNEIRPTTSGSGPQNQMSPVFSEINHANVFKDSYDLTLCVQFIRFVHRVANKCRCKSLLSQKKGKFQYLNWCRVQRLTRVAHPLLERLLQATHVEWFGRHADQRHDLQELFLASVTELLNVVTACKRRTCTVEMNVRTQWLEWRSAPSPTRRTLYFNWVPLHEDVLGSGIIAPRILDLGTR